MRWKGGGQGVDWLHAGFSERAGGVSTAYGGEGPESTLNLGWTEVDLPERVAENRRRWVDTVWHNGLDSLATSPGTAPELVTLSQVHSADSLVVRRGETLRDRETGRTTLRGDGLMTAEPSLLLGVQTADCVPVLVADVRLRAVAAFHAGWRGTVGRIVQHGVRQMGTAFGSKPEDLWAAVGPAIASCCYSVGDEVEERFRGEFPYGEALLARRAEKPQWERMAGGPTAPEEGRREDERQRRLYLDLHESNRRQLLEAGVPGQQITVLRECTACSRTGEGRMRYFSYRAEQGRTGRMMAVVGVQVTG